MLAAIQIAGVDYQFSRRVSVCMEQRLVYGVVQRLIRRQELEQYYVFIE
jgi:hypothetical protein